MNLTPCWKWSSTSTFDVSARVTSETFISRRLVQSSPPEDKRGRKLCAETNSLKTGDPLWPKYEELCDRILHYLFKNDLLGWHRQRVTHYGLNRFDYVCRILPGRDFWEFLIEHLNSRYVLFEFKNYSRRISQGQILTR